MEDTLAEIIAEIDQVLYKRDASFPVRDLNNDRRVQVLQAVFIERVNGLSLTEPSVSPLIKKDIADELKDNCIFLCGYMKCGTTLLLELLDAHPELICLPGDSWFRGHKFLVGDQSAERFASSFRDKWLGRVVNPTGQAPFWLFGKEPQAYIDFVNHYCHWLKIINDSQRGHLLSTVLAYYTANPARPAQPRMWVEKTPGNEFDVERILHYFPAAKFIHIVRDPRENFASVKRLYKTRNWDWSPLEMASNIGKSCRLSKENQAVLGRERYFVLQYEELTQNPQKALEKICHYLQVSWSSSLLTPTVNGMVAQSNTMYRDRMIAGNIRPATKDRWASILNAREKRAILKIDRDARIAGYDWKVSYHDTLMHYIDKMAHYCTIGKEKRSS